MERRRFNSMLAGGALGSAMPAAAAPNIVLIMADDLGYGDLGCYGHPTIRTPHIDGLASGGMKFLQFYSASPLCTPSRVALLTGRLPIRTGLNRVLSPIAKRGIRSREITIAEALKSRGYATACVGKWHLGRLPKFLPTRHGFDSYFGIPYSNDMSRRTKPGHPVYRMKIVPPLPLMRDKKIIEREPDQSQLTKRYTSEAVQFITAASQAGKPFFLYLPHTFPHPPLHASEQFAGKSPRGLYGDVVEEIDWSTGQILGTLRELGVEDNTLFIFTSDNGPWLAKKQEGGSAGHFREGKGSTWEGGVRVPFIARWPGRIPAGVVTQAFATLMDLFPTCAKLAGAEIPDDRVYDGEDLSPVLFDNQPGREPLMFYWFREKLRAVRRGPWKLHVVTNSPANGTREKVKHDPPLLYNLSEDPSETRDVAASHPDVVRDLLDLMERHKKAIKAGTATAE